MADDERGERRSLRAKWRERRADRVAHRAERAVQKAEGRARLVAARDSADGQARTNSGERVR
jgi:hypothetical protein